MPGFRNARKYDTTARGYGTAHQRERARWKPIVESGRAWCQQGLTGNGSSGRCIHSSRWIKPGTRWALGHNDARTAWIGPVHADCNQRDAASRGAKIANRNRKHHRHATTWRSRNW